MTGKEEHAIKYTNEGFEMVLKRLNRNLLKKGKENAR